MPSDDTKALVVDRSKLEAALGGCAWLNADRLTMLAQDIWERGGEHIRSCGKEALGAKILQCAYMGLEPNTGLGHVYILPFWSEKANKYFLQLIVGYKGFQHLAYMSGSVDDLRTDIVCEDETDSLVWDPLDKRRPIIHHPKLLGGIRETIESVRPDSDGIVKGVVGAYTVAFLTNGLIKAHWSSVAEILKARSMSEAVKSKKGPLGPWMAHPLDMYRKTPVRRICSKELRLTGEIAPRMAAALTLDPGEYRVIEEAERERIERMDRAIDNPAQPEPKQKSAATPPGGAGTGKEEEAFPPSPKSPQPSGTAASPDPGITDQYLLRIMSTARRCNVDMQRLMELSFDVGGVGDPMKLTQKQAAELEQRLEQETGQ